MTEQQLASSVKEWLLENRWEVFSEVRRYPDHGPRADLVARNGKLIWVIECKTSLSISLMAQASEWVRYANYVSVAVPSARRSNARQFAKSVLRGLGIGTLTIDSSVVVESEKPKLCRTNIMISAFGKMLGSQHVHDGAGSPSDYWSPYRQTCSNLRRIVQNHNGITQFEAFQRLGSDHHYSTQSSMRANLSQWISRGCVKGIVRKKEGRHVKLYLEAEL